ncbi:hypothetical protein FHS16_001732 [Paenibacillus endophyticus]|uniref:Uncharacterized protein n=1 Tax=Paenibacillus endophyticus TaxID=1294268 RepID=A0A7W5C5W2_9BACL|nr:hypothetical protein [Paenibacillus endophyticus]MBB3151686.1 hypothetical protein [Paenibacillus endophyticus]
MKIKHRQKKPLTNFHGIYLVLDTGGPGTRIANLKTLISQFEAEGKRMPIVFFLDDKPKLLASRFEPE